MSSNSDRKSSLRFAGNVGPDDVETETYTAQQDATVEEVAVRIYQGPRLDLRVVPFLERGEPGYRERVPLVELRGKDYVDGDNDYWIFPTSEAVREGEVLGVEVRNVDGSNTYDYAVDMVIDRAGGMARPVESFLSRLRRVF
ncbi:hypothetical protein C453_04034 [Haloferax elongans ATCC BAA-1513]|uniref:Uncharacterized protein n=1 Tax=Haloferax elongans ATCC BAA-1513 TaxID=1230453 RepID=M0HSQ0_HALEO|nr:hypothetical protein [Haloferax elongans]ELZ87491.1 hypothetical protein C453_04034 [Haloferax elongans ATCC BAA-1513]